MRNKFFKNFTTVIGILFFNIIISSTVTLGVNNEKAWEVENNLNTKIKNVISNLYPINQFSVTSNIVLLGANNSFSNTSTSFGALELEGILPSLPQSSTSGTVTNADNYKIQIKDITVWLDYGLDVIDAQQNIKKFLFESIDWLENCNNCLKFRSKAFPGSSNINPSSFSNSNPGNMATEDDIRILEDGITYLTEEIEKYKTNSSTEKNQWMIDWLNRALQEEKELNTQLSKQLQENSQNIIRRDSSIIMNTTMGQKEIAETAMKENSRIVEKVSDNQFENNRYMLIVLFVLIGIVVLLVLLSFFNKGPQTVYLKPKDNKDSSPNNTDNSNLSGSSNTTANVPITPETIQAELTKAYEDDSVLQSDLKTIKQSAVKMSVGQKHEASQILKDWLDDGKSNEGEDNAKPDEENK